MTTPETFELLGVSGLRLPGTKERPCPFDMVYNVEWYSAVLIDSAKNMANSESRRMSMRAATASCWWAARAVYVTVKDDEREALNQCNKWQLVFERASERLKA